MKLSVTEIALAWKSSVRRQSLFSSNVHERGICGCLRARVSAQRLVPPLKPAVEITALIMRLRGSRGSGDKDRVSVRHRAVDLRILKFVSIRARVS